MSKVLELREKRAKAWEAAKAFLDTKRGTDGLLSAGDTETYEKMEKDVVDLGKEIERLERQAAIDAELNRPTSMPITNKPNGDPDGVGDLAQDDLAIQQGVNDLVLQAPQGEVGLRQEVP